MAVTLPPLLPRISDYPSWWATYEPDREALVLNDTAIGYRELASRIDELAKAMLALGIGHGDRVATLQTPCPEFVVAWLATASIGAIWVGLNPKYRIAELVAAISDAQPKLLLTRTEIDECNYTLEIAAMQGATRDSLTVVQYADGPVVDGALSYTQFKDGGKHIGLEDLVAARGATSGSDPCAIVYTSGSTGVPKGALLSHKGIAAFALEQNRIWPVSPHRNLNFLPINHIGCLCDVTMPAIVAGGTLVFMEQFDPAAATRALDVSELTIWGSLPTVFGLQMTTAEYQQAALGSLQLIVWEGAAMPRDTIVALLTHGVPMATNYSMTESVGSITALRPTRDIDLLSNTVGTEFPGVEIRLVSEDGRLVSEGEVGEVQIRSAYAFVGYWCRPEETAACFSTDGFFKTGDLASRRADGHYTIVGRLKEMFKSGGYNVYPREIEAVIESHPAVHAAAVVAVADPIWQEVGTAFVVGAPNLEAELLRDWCRERLANFKVPKHFVLTNELPLLPVGKVDRSELRARATAMSMAAALAIKSG
jgi:acyl-CoA synthetase (AMP-forming)/AMP-acid ligase II